LIDGFSNEVWSALCQKQKARHSLFHCNGCLKIEKYRALLAKFPIKENDYTAKKRAKEGGLYKPNTSEMRKITTEKMAELDKEFVKEHGCSFQEASKNLKAYSKRKEKTEMARQFKRTVEKLDEDTIVLRFEI